MVASQPPGLWLRSDGCPHGPIWVAADFSENGAMYLEKGWKLFFALGISQREGPFYFHMMVMRPYGQGFLTRMVIESAAVLRVRATVMKISTTKQRKFLMNKPNPKMTTEALLFSS